MPLRTKQAEAFASPIQQRVRQPDAFDGLMACLKDLATIIKTADDPAEGPRLEDHKRRKKFLLDYRNWVVNSTEFPGEKLVDSEYLDRLFPYIHNEFHFNAARKLGRLARVSHIVFAPLYTERTADNQTDELKHLREGAQQTLDWILQHAVHKNRGETDFRGGKDYFFTFITELFDYSEPILTPKRLIIEEKEKAVAQTVCGQARIDTAVIDEQVIKSGISNRSTSVVEFFYKASKLEKVHSRWVRHDRPYQTFTVTQENVITADAEAHRDIAAFLSSEAWFEYFQNPAKRPFTDPFGTTALHALKHDIFHSVVGRYVQGANYLVLPLKLFLRRPLEEKTEGTLVEALTQLLPDEKDTFANAARWLETPLIYNGLKDIPLERALQRIRDDESRKKTAEFDRLIASVTRDFLKLCFREESGFETEYVAFKCMGGRAFVFSDVRNNTREGDVAHRELFSRTVIIDCGMNGFERGRLVQNLTEFETERVLALLNLPRFRLVHQALNAIQSRLSLANANYHDNCPQSEEVIPPHYRKRRGLTVKDQLDGERGLIVALEWLSSCLTVLNDVVEGGVSGRARIMTGSVQIIEGKLDSIGHQPLVGHLSLQEFIERRFIRSARTIERTGERYRMLRQRITENAELVDARLQVLQRDKEVLLLQAAEVFVAFGGAYYSAEILVNIFKPLIAKLPEIPLQFFGLKLSGELLADTALFTVCGILALILTAIFHRRRKAMDPHGPD